jgi:hypothetical protein
MTWPSIAQESAESDRASSMSGTRPFTEDLTKLMLVSTAASGFRMSCAKSAMSSDK